MNATEAIEWSITHNELVVYCDDTKDNHAILTAECDDVVDVNDIFEYWGQNWHVHIKSKRSHKMSNNYRKQAIDIIGRNKYANADLLREISKDRPSAIVKAAAALEAEHPVAWKAEARAFMQAGRKIQAIKVCRVATGLGLKDAKGAVEAL